MYVCMHTAVCQHNFSASYYAYGIRSWYGYRKSTLLPAGFVSCCPKDVMSSSIFFLVPASLYTGRALRTVVVILNQAISCLQQYFFLLRNCCLSVTNCNVVVIRRYYHVEVTMILTAIAYVALLLCILRARRVRAVVLLYAYSN